jgi:hypothetical protein
MSRVTSKKELLNTAARQWDYLWRLINALPEDFQKAPFKFEDRDRNLRDILCHLHEWHNMMKVWHRTGCMEGGIPHVPAPGHSWRTINTLNLEIWQSYQSTSLYNAKELLKASHKTMMWLIDSHTDRELTQPGAYKWTGDKWSLGDFFKSNTAQHYEWAMRKIRKAMKHR